MAAKSNQSIARRYLISGRVQGVGYRAFAQRAAREFGVTGWARNLVDGSVEVHANGSAVKLDEFEGRLRLGPRWGEVRGVEVTETVVSAISEFLIR
jgi:acylphosphatase